MALMAASFMNRNLEDHHNKMRRAHRHKHRKRAGSDARLPQTAQFKEASHYHNQQLLTVPGTKLKHKRSISQPDISRLNEIRGRYRGGGRSQDGSQDGLSDGSSHSPTPPHPHHRSRGNSDTPIPHKVKHRSKSRTPMDEGRHGHDKHHRNQRTHSRRTSEDSQYGQHANLMTLHPAEPGQATRKRSMSIAGGSTNGMGQGHRNPFSKLWRQMQKLKVHHQSSPEYD